MHNFSLGWEENECIAFRDSNISVISWWSVLSVEETGVPVLYYCKTLTNGIRTHNVSAYKH
jgi:hypothetical protein